MFTPSMKRMGVLICVLFLTAGTAWAQLTTGNLFGTTVDSDGEPLPGVTVTLTGQGAPQVRMSDEQGQFLNYRTQAEWLVNYVRETGFTHIELLPVTEHPFPS